MHDTMELTLACSKDEHISKNNFLGVFAADKIPYYIPSLCCFIMNTDKHGLEGEHWVAIFCKQGKKFYFDSYDGNEIYENENWRQFLSRDWIRNDIVLQQLDSDVCGDYCVYFLKKMSCMETPSLEFLKKDFDVDDPSSNDFRVWEKVHSTFPKTLDKISHDINLNDITDEKLVKLIRDTLKESKQICKSRKSIKMSVSRKRKHLY